MPSTLTREVTSECVNLHYRCLNMVLVLRVEIFNSGIDLSLEVHVVNIVQLFIDKIQYKDIKDNELGKQMK